MARTHSCSFARLGLESLHDRITPAGDVTADLVSNPDGSATLHVAGDRHDNHVALASGGNLDNTEFWIALYVPYMSDEGVNPTYINGVGYGEMVVFATTASQINYAIDMGASDDFVEMGEVRNFATNDIDVDMGLGHDTFNKAGAPIVQVQGDVTIRNATTINIDGELCRSLTISRNLTYGEQMSAAVTNTTVTGNLSVSGDARADVLRLDGDSVGGDLRITMAQGDDTVWINNVSVEGLTTLDGGVGRDSLIVTGYFNTYGGVEVISI